MIDIENLSYHLSNSKKSIFIAANHKANVKVYIIDYEENRGNSHPYGLTLIDECDYLDNPYGSILDATID